MEIRLAKSYGFCFGVKRAIKIAESSKNAVTIGSLIHNNEEINRLKESFNVTTAHSIYDLKGAKKAIIRTHGITKDDLSALKQTNTQIIDATCPYVTKPQEIVQEMSQKGYQIIIFGDEAHPEVKGVKSYAINKPIVVLNIDELHGIEYLQKVAVVSQTTRKMKEFLKIVDFLVANVREVRIFNTICNATFDNQDAAKELSHEVDIMLVVGGKNSSNTKQLYSISVENCKHCFLIENEKELQQKWFENHKVCGITAGASTPNWIIERIIAQIREFSV